MRNHFAEVDWSKFYGAKAVEGQWLSLLEIYNGEIRQNTPKLGRRDKKYILVQNKM